MTGWQGWIAAAQGVTSGGALPRKNGEQHTMFALPGEQRERSGGLVREQWWPLEDHGILRCAEADRTCCLGALFL